MGERRWGLSISFPFHDNNGLPVISERRQRPDRRLDKTTLEERLLMFTGAVHAAPDTDRQ